ncbi:MAG: hypothetical protein R2867_15225 [Caldilineaceae bacterium]
MLFDDDRFVKALGNTLLFAVMTVPLGTALSLLLAVLVNQPPRRHLHLSYRLLSAGGHLLCRRLFHLALDLRTPIRSA